jgi:hypothetical protein
MIKQFKLMVRVGGHWVPAHLGGMSREKAKRLQAAYRQNRPDAFVKIVPVGESADA